MCFSRFFPSEPASFYSAYPLEETRAKLADAFAPDTFASRLKYGRRNAFYITLGPKRVSIRYRKAGQSSGMATIFAGKFLPESIGVSISGRFRPPATALGFM
jgi:hypothetical protein